MDGKPRLIPERAAVIKRIFALAADGMGYTRLVKQLQKARVPAFGKKIVRAERTRSPFAGAWTKSSVSPLLLLVNTSAL